MSWLVSLALAALPEVSVTVAPGVVCLEQRALVDRLERSGLAVAALRSPRLHVDVSLEGTVLKVRGLRAGATMERVVPARVDDCVSVERVVAALIQSWAQQIRPLAEPGTLPTHRGPTDGGLARPSDQPVLEAAATALELRGDPRDGGSATASLDLVEPKPERVPAGGGLPPRSGSGLGLAGASTEPREVEVGSPPAPRAERRQPSSPSLIPAPAERRENRFEPLPSRTASLPTAGPASSADESARLATRAPEQPSPPIDSAPAVSPSLEPVKSDPPGVAAADPPAPTRVTLSPAEPASPRRPWRLDLFLGGGGVIGPTASVAGAGAFGVTFMPARFGVAVDVGLESQRSGRVEPALVVSDSQWLSLRGVVQFDPAERLLLRGSLGLRGFRLSATSSGVLEAGTSNVLSLGGVVAGDLAFRLVGRFFLQLTLFGSLRVRTDRFIVEGLEPVLVLQPGAVGVLGGLSWRGVGE